ncbi:hypothetical protein N9C31_03335 [Gammaproteobacteria bacterium]|nr:hypothetical protein [Gammaproteobacteria bacterium]
MSKLGIYLFGPDSSNANLDSVDSWAELAAHLEAAENTDLGHYDQMVFLMLQSTDNISDFDYVFNGLSADFSTGLFTNLNDYIDSTLTGFDHDDHTITSTFGGVSHDNGIDFIRDILADTNGLQDLLIALEAQNASGPLAGIYTAMTNHFDGANTEAHANSLLMSQADYATFVTDNSIDVSTLDISAFFTSENQTDAFITLYIDRLEAIIQEGANVYDTSGTLISDLRALISKDTASASSSGLENAFNLSVQNHLASWGTYLYMSDAAEESTESNDTDQYALSHMSYEDLIGILETASADATKLFISTLPFAAKSLLDTHFTHTPNGNSISTDFENNSLSALSDYVAIGSTLDVQVMNLFKGAGLVSFTDIDAAKALTFSDINMVDVKNMISDIATYSPHQLLWSVLDDSNIDQSLTSDDAMHAFFTAGLFANVTDVQDLIHMAVYNPSAFDQYFHTEINGVTLADTVSNNIAALSQQDLQLYLNQFITHLENITSSASELFIHFATPFVADTYAMAIDHHLNKLGAYLFEADPLNENAAGIDTIGELGTQLNITDHDEGRLYLKLLSDESINLLSAHFTDGFNSSIFTTFSDYIDDSHIGFDANSTTVFGGITHFEGKVLINDIITSTDGVNDLKIILETHNSNHALSGIYDQIVTGETDVDVLFDTETKTDAFIQLFIDQLQNEYQVLTGSTSVVLSNLSTAISKTNYDMADLGAMALDQIDSDLGAYYFRSDNQDSDTFSSNYTYSDLISILEQANADTYALFLKMMPLDSSLPATYASFQEEITNDSLSNTLINAFKNAGFIASNIDTSAALSLTFGDITESDMKSFIIDQMNLKPGNFLAAFMTTDTNNVFDSSDGLFDRLNDALLDGNDIGLTEIGFHIQRLGIESFNANKADYINADINQNVSLLSSSDLQSMIDHMVEYQLTDQNDLYASGNKGALLFNYFIQADVKNIYDDILASHLSELGTHLFDPSALSTLETIDSWDELANHFNNQNSNPLSHYDQLAYLMLLNDTQLSDLDYLFNDLSIEYPALFTEFADYTDATHSGWLTDINQAFSGIDLSEGQAFITSIWNGTNGVAHLLLSLYHSNNSDLTNIFNAIHTEVTESMSTAESDNLLNILIAGDINAFNSHVSDESIAYNSIAIIDDYFTAEALTDSYILTYIDHLEEMIQAATDQTDTAGSLIQDLRALVLNNSAVSGSDLSITHELAFNQLTSFFGAKLLQSDPNDSDDFASSNHLTYADLIALLELTEVAGTAQFIGLLSHDLQNTIGNYLSGIYDTNNQLVSFAEVSQAMGSSNFTTQIIQLLQTGGYISAEIDEASALALEFGDITTDDIQSLLSDMLNHEPHALLLALLHDQNQDNMIESSEVNPTWLNDSHLDDGLTWTEIATMASFNPMAFNAWFAESALSNHIATAINTASIDNLQSLVDLITDRLENGTDSSATGELLLLHQILNPVVEDREGQALSAHLDLLGQYVFADDILNQNDANIIDTHAELADLLENTNNTLSPEIMFHENLFYLSLFTDYSHLSTLFSTDIVTDINSHLFTDFNDYITDTLKGFDQNNLIEFGGISYQAGLSFIQEIWNDSSHYGKLDLLIMLKASQNAALNNIFDNIEVDANQTLDIDAISHADFALALNGTANGYIAITDLDSYFTTEAETDALIGTILDHANERFQTATGETTNSEIYTLATQSLTSNNPENTLYQDIHHEAVEASLSYFGAILLQENTQGVFTYDTLSTMIENGSDLSSQMLIKLLPQSVIDTLLSSLTETDANGRTFAQAMGLNEISKLTDYLASGNDFSTVLITALQSHGFMSQSLTLDEAKQTTFGAISREDVIQLMENISNDSASTFIKTIATDDNANLTFDSADIFYGLFNQTNLSSGDILLDDLIHMAIVNPSELDSRTIYPDYADQLNGTQITNGLVTPLTSTATLQQYLSLFQDEYESYFESLAADSSSAVQDEMLVFFNMIDQPVSDALNESLDHQMHKLGEYLFDADSTEPEDGIDTYAEFDARMMDNSINQEILHYENEIYLELINTDSNGEYPFESLNERSAETAFNDTLIVDYGSGLFTTFSDYSDGINTVGLNSDSNSTYGDVNYAQGLEFINSIWQDVDQSSMFDLLTTLYHSEDSSLESIFGLMDDDATGDLYTIGQMNREDFNPDDLGLLDNGAHTLTMADYFTNEEETDLYVDLYLTHIDEQYKIQIDDDSAGSVTDDLGLTG